MHTDKRAFKDIKAAKKTKIKKNKGEVNSREMS